MEDFLYNLSQIFTVLRIPKRIDIIKITNLNEEVLRLSLSQKSAKIVRVPINEVILSLMPPDGFEILGKSDEVEITLLSTNYFILPHHVKDEIIRIVSSFPFNSLSEEEIKAWFTESLRILARKSKIDTFTFTYLNKAMALVEVILNSEFLVKTMKTMIEAIRSDVFKESVVDYEYLLKTLGAIIRIYSFIENL